MSEGVVASQVTLVFLAAVCALSCRTVLLRASNVWTLDSCPSEHATPAPYRRGASGGGADRANGGRAQWIVAFRDLQRGGRDCPCFRLFGVSSEDDRTRTASAARFPSSSRSSHVVYAAGFPQRRH